MFFCCFQLWQLFPIWSIEALFYGEQYWCYTYRRFEDDVSVWSCEVAIRRMIGEDIEWLLWFLLDDYHLKLKVGCRIDFKAKLFRRHNGNKDIRIVWTLFLSLLSVLLLLSWWLQTWMDLYVNYGEEFAGMSRRQVRRRYRLHILATSSPKRQILMLQRLGSHLLKEILW